VLDKGARNVEILKQPQYTPYKVEEQIAIIFCGSRGLLQRVPLSEIRNFETSFINYMHDHHEDLLAILRSGKIDDDIMKQLENACAEVVKTFEVK